MENIKVMDYLLLIMGIYCVIRGIITITTGKLTPSEEKTVKNYSEKGLRKYKILSSVTNIIGGLLCTAMFGVRFINGIDTNMVNIVIIAIIAIMLIIYFIINKSCKEAK